MLSKDEIRTNVSRVRAHKAARVEALAAQIAAVGTPHDLTVRLGLERMQKDLSALKADLARTDAQLAAL